MSDPSKHDRYFADNYKNPHAAKVRKGTKRYRYCRRHDDVEPSSSRCFRAAPVASKSAAVHVYKPWTNVVLDDEPIRIESKAQHRRECARRGILCPE